ncbi:MAG: DUF4019 domain-containing protein [Burkholderiaceae bacterium]
MRKSLPAIAMLGFVFLPLAAAQGQDTQRLAEQTVEATRQDIASTNADPAWRPSPQQRSLIETTTKAYFAARDANNSEGAYAFLSARQRQSLQPNVFQRLLEEFNARAGAVQGRRLRAITWYKDTPQGGPGLYVAVDYSSEFANLALHCGYIVWHEQLDGSFLQVREETNIIDKATMDKLKPGDFEKIRAQFRC